MDGRVWEKVSDFFIQHSREGECMQVYDSHTATFKKGTVPCFYSPKEPSENTGVYV